MKKHDLDWFSLVAGSVFLLVAVTHLVSAASDERPDLGWLVPALLVGVGLAGVASALRGVLPDRTEPATRAAVDGHSGTTDDTAVLPLRDDER